jgi:hypothetical protein
MVTLASDEKKALVMAYTPSMLLRGEIVAKESIRTSIWLRTDSAPEYMHFVNAQVLNFLGGQIHPAAYEELYFPVAQLICFHLVPPASDPLDYDAAEANRVMKPVTLMVGSFLIKGKVRISSQVNFGTSLSTLRIQWMSIYDADVSNPLLPQMGHLSVPMLVLRPSQVVFGIG